MLEVKKEGVILSKTNHGFEIDGVLNPAVIHYGDFIHIFYRAVAKFNYSSIGYAKLKTPLEVVERLDVPVIFSQFEYEEHGVEDPRIVPPTTYQIYTSRITPRLWFVDDVGAFVFTHPIAIESAPHAHDLATFGLRPCSA